MTIHRPAIFLVLALSMAATVADEQPAGQEKKQPASQNETAQPALSAQKQKANPVAKSNTRPPKNLKFINGHWTPYEPPKLPDEAKPYIIVPKDTLWALSARFNGDPMLWPQIWDQNRYIVDSHWIYPGDPIVIPAPPTVVPPSVGNAPASMTTIEEEEEAPKVAQAPAPPAPPKPTPLADKEDLYCSGYIDADYRQPEMRIAGTDEEKIGQAQGDVVYVNRGSRDGVSVGSEYDVIRPISLVQDPETDKPMGTLVDRRGRIRVIAVQAGSATAEVSFSCVDIGKGDRLVPKWDPDVPAGSPARPMDRYGTNPSGKAQGYVVAAPFNILAMGLGNVIQVSLGANAGLRPGDRISIYRPNESGPDYARKLLGTGFVVTVRPASSAVKITESAREVYVGDRVEIQ